jgi:hypothetical protein
MFCNTHKEGEKMVALDLVQETSPSSSKLIVTPKEMEGEGKASFSELLKEIKVGDAKNSIKSSLSTLLQGISTDDLDSENEKLQLLSKEDVQQLVTASDLKEINPDIKSSLSESELKMLIKDAKDYLKNQILATDGFKRSEIKHLPKTLKGLTQMAQKYGLAISKIRLEEVNADTSKSKGFKVDLEKKGNAHKLLQSTPLFKAQQSSEISTEQIVGSKASHTQNLEQKSTKKRADDTLRLLLQGEKAANKESSGFTADFSVAAAKVIAPTQKGDMSKLASLEALLQPENISDEAAADKSSAKADGLTVAKADSFEVKLNEAKQMVKYLSQDVKQAIDNYKAPFTRLKVQLNPQQLGEIELTVVQRGKNLHVNLSSNNAAINALAMNANELKVQLQNSGINNASLNFSNNAQGGESAYSGGQTQQQQHQHEKQQYDAYNFYENEEHEEVLNSLEIVIANYA